MNHNQREKRGEKVLYTAWYCPNGEMGHFVCYMATAKHIKEHLKECEFNKLNAKK